MPVQPDPTHPKFLEGDDVRRPASAQEDDVEGHLRAAAATEEPSTEPENLRSLVTDDGSDDVEGHFRA